MKYDLCIIGGGASGMTAAITAKKNNPGMSVLILEKNARLGSKVLASGNGKCNLSNQSCDNNNVILDFFEEIGIITRTDAEGRLYPYTEEAAVVVQAMENAMKRAGVNVMLNAAVSSVEKKDYFEIALQSGKLFKAEKLLIACGGKAGSKFGTTGEGYKWARSLGHTVNKPIPVLTAVEVKENTAAFAGIRAKADVSLEYRGNIIFSERGEVQFTKTGISGICVFNLSRFLMIPEGKTLVDGFDDYKVLIDFLPDIHNLNPLLAERKKSGISMLLSLVREPVADYVAEVCGDDAEQIGAMVKAFPLSPKGVKGWDYAQATRGGVETTEIDSRTMESFITDNLFFAGEIIDFDGPCGGYNLNNAWFTGLKAGRGTADV